MPRPGPRPYECIRRAWHSESHQALRGSITQEIFRIVTEFHRPETRCKKEWQEKLPIVVLRAEEILYSKARTQAEYTDISTLKARLDDAVNTMIRRTDETKKTEEGPFMQPCVEAALSLGCIPKMNPRGQKSCSSRISSGSHNMRRLTTQNSVSSSSSTVTSATISTQQGQSLAFLNMDPSWSKQINPEIIRTNLPPFAANFPVMVPSNEHQFNKVINLDHPLNIRARDELPTICFNGDGFATPKINPYSVCPVSSSHRVPSMLPPLTRNINSNINSNTSIINIEEEHDLELSLGPPKSSTKYNRTNNNGFSMHKEIGERSVSNGGSSMSWQCEHESNKRKASVFPHPLAAAAVNGFEMAKRHKELRF